MKKVTILLGSPRKKGNTYLLVEEMQRAFKENGAESEILYLYDMNFKGCIACYYCKKNSTSKCILEDDMQKVYKALETSDAFVIASPIYFCEVTAETRKVLERFFPYYDMYLTSSFPKGKKAAFIFTQNQPNKELFQNNIEMTMNMIKMLGVEVVDHMLGYNLDKGSKPLVTDPVNKQFMEKAYEIGKKLLSSS